MRKNKEAMKRTIQLETRPTFNVFRTNFHIISSHTYLLICRMFVILLFSVIEEMSLTVLTVSHNF